MILLLDTSTFICHIWLYDGESEQSYEWEANRELADKLLGFLVEKLALHQKTLHDLSAIGVMKGPGSFTGLRIGLTICNTLASSLEIPIVGEMGKDWRDKAIKRISAGDNEQIVLPHYGSEANVTVPRK